MIAPPVQEVTMQDLSMLPVRATVAFAVRCASRVQPLLQAIPDSLAKETTLQNSSTALTYAAEFARNGAAALPSAAELTALAQQIYDVADQVAGDSRFAAYAAGHAVASTGIAVGLAQGGQEHEALDFVANAWGAYRVLIAFVSGLIFKDMFTGNMVLNLIRADYDRLRELHPGRFTELGASVDPSEGGALGPLWPDQRPCWLG